MFEEIPSGSSRELSLDAAAEIAARVFRMMADPTRVRALWFLREGELPVGELAELLDRPQALVSQHLTKLRLAELVTTRRQGNRMFYRLANGHVRSLVVDGIFHAEHLGSPAPRHHQNTDAAAGPSQTTGGSP